MIYNPTHSQSYQTGQLAYVANTTPFILCHQSQWTSHREMGHTGPLSREGQKKTLILLTTFRPLFLTGKTERAIRKRFNVAGAKTKEHKTIPIKKNRQTLFQIEHLMLTYRLHASMNSYKIIQCHICHFTFQKGEHEHPHLAAASIIQLVLSVS